MDWGAFILGLLAGIVFFGTLFSIIFGLRIKTEPSVGINELIRGQQELIASLYILAREMRTQRDAAYMKLGILVDDKES